MNYVIDNESKKPAYLQLYEMIRDDIVSGVYPYGSKIPSKRLIAEETGVSVITAEHAASLLEEEGYVESRERSGNFVIFREHDFVSTRFTVPHSPHGEAVMRSRGDFPFSVLQKTVHRVLLDYGDRILDKSPSKGSVELRNEISQYLARSRSIHVNPSQIIIGSGAEYLYGLIAQLFIDKGLFAVEFPSYDKITKVYESFGIECDLLTLRKNGIDSLDLDKTKANVLHTTPFNSFPSGVTIGAAKKMEYIAWARERGGFIIEDNYDSELTVSRKAEDSLFSLTDSQNVIYLNTFSHTIAPSLRVGYMVIPETLVEEFEQKLGFYSCTVPVLDQFVLAELLASGDFERHINRVRRQRRKALEKAKRL